MEYVTAADFVRHFGSWQDRVARDPVVVTHHGRQRMVMLSVQQYERLAANDRNGAVNDDELKLSVLVDRLFSGLIGIDRDLRVTEANATAAAHFALARSAMIGRPIDELGGDLSHSIARTHLGRTLATGEVIQFEMPSVQRQGSWLRGQVFPYGHGAALLFRNVDREMEGVRLASQLASEKAALLAHGSIGHGRLSVRATFVEVDATFATLAGFEPSQLSHVRLTDILPLQLRASATAEIEAVLGAGGARAFDSRLLVRQGGELPVRIALAELRGEYAIDGASVVVTPALRAAA